MNLIHKFRYKKKQEIEAIANQILIKMAKDSKYVPKWPLDSSRVAEFLGLDIVWDKIDPDEEGTIAARILPLKRLIEINEDIPQLRGGFGESTIAHEVGHWVLHINHEALKDYLQLSKQGMIPPTSRLICRSQQSQGGREWQAQYFATCLLMPRNQLDLAVKDKNLDNWRHLYQAAEELGVTISNLVHRLKDLGWIQVTPNSRKITVLNLPGCR